MTNLDMIAQIRSGDGFIAALDQSGGSTPNALQLYGVEESAYVNDDEMYDLIHGMRTRIIRAPAFSGDKIIGAILFEMTMDRDVDGTPTAEHLWSTFKVVPFLKCDKGLEGQTDGVRLLRPIPNLDALCQRAVAKGIFGTKMRSLISAASTSGINAVVAQQFQFARQIMSHGLVPIIEPEVTISIADKAQAEELLLRAITAELDLLPEGQQVMLKLTLPETANHYLPLVQHKAVMRVVALSGGYSRTEANTRLCANTGVIASFSRALTEGLNARQTDTEFNAEIAQTIHSIFNASCAG
jgi:fructose-bisphosphate aldolase class I